MVQLHERCWRFEGSVLSAEESMWTSNRATKVELRSMSLSRCRDEYITIHDSMMCAERPRHDLCCYAINEGSPLVRMRCDFRIRFGSGTFAQFCQVSSGLRRSAKVPKSSVP